MPTKAAPALLAPSEVPAFREAVARKLDRVIAKHERAMTELMERDRKNRDSAESYALVYDQCASIEWEAAAASGSSVVRFP
ncbi:MAG: hypothetical protein HY077_17365 [Elusimicrobia bacterium]|nr:hypothetical protein [Elusimicrobiota bacterium]